LVCRLAASGQQRCTSWLRNSGQCRSQPLLSWFGRGRNRARPSESRSRSNFVSWEFPINCHNSRPGIMFRPDSRIPCPERTSSGPTGGPRNRRAHYRLDKKAVGAQLLNLSSWKGSGRRTWRIERSVIRWPFCETSEGPWMTPPGRTAAFTAAAYVRASA
jgi:hypothetical protein